MTFIFNKLKRSLQRPLYDPSKIYQQKSRRSSDPLVLQNRTANYERKHNASLTSKKLLKLTMPNPSDLRQILLAAFMILFFVSSMTLVWTFSVIVPYLRGITYEMKTCRLFGVQGIPESCWGHTFFRDLVFDSTTKRSCAEEDCAQMLQDRSCVQFYVQEEFYDRKNSSTFILHQDEVDISGLCQSQMHCSVRPKRSQSQSFSSNQGPTGSCLRNVDCDSVARSAKDLFRGEDSLRLGLKRECWINKVGENASELNNLQVTGAMARKSLGSFFGGKVFHAVFWPLLGFMSSILCCTTFWYKNRNHVLKFTQSG